MHGADPPEKWPSSRSIDGRGSDLPGIDTATTYATRVASSRRLVFHSGQSVNSPSSVRSVLVGKVGKQGSSGRSRSRRKGRRGRGRSRLSAINGPEQSPPEARDAMLPLPPPCHRLNTSPQSAKYARRRHISAQQCRRPIAGYMN
jgi:hypothetical protein